MTSAMDILNITVDKEPRRVIVDVLAYIRPTWDKETLIIKVGVLHLSEPLLKRSYIYIS